MCIYTVISVYIYIYTSEDWEKLIQTHSLLKTHSRPECPMPKSKPCKKNIMCASLLSLSLYSLVINMAPDNCTCIKYTYTYVHIYIYIHI